MSTASSNVLDVHTPFSSFVVIHSITQDSLQSLYDKLTRKVNNSPSYHGERVGPGWLKYEFNDSIWDLEDDSDYTIFVWRQQQQISPPGPPERDLAASFSSAASTTAASTTTTTTATTTTTTTTPPRNPTIHLHHPKQPLPVPPEYQNPKYYVFSSANRRNGAPDSNLNANSGAQSVKSRNSTMRRKKKAEGESEGEPSFKQTFNKFHSENGVRTVMGSIGPVKNVRMLLKPGYRHVYISRNFALEHGFLPADAAPGHYGYSGLVNIGTWPITLTPSTVPSSLPDAPPSVTQHHTPATTSPNGRSSPSTEPGPRPGGNVLLPGNASTFTKKSKRSSAAKDTAEGSGPKPTMMTVYLSEEPHFDVVLGRSFFERRQIRLTAVDPTDVVCMDTGEKIECELVILKDGRGEIITVT